MRVQLADCLLEPVAFDTLVELDKQGLTWDEFESTPVVRSRGLARCRAQEKIAVSGSLEARTRPICSRCLESFDHVLTRDFELTFIPAVAAPAEKVVVDLEPSSAESYDGTYEGDELELDPSLAEQFILAIPMRFLCSEDCPGLCTQCGASRRNQPACGCDADAVDPRFEVLKSLLH